MILKTNDSKVNNILANQAELVFWSAVIFSIDQLEILRSPRPKRSMIEPGRKLISKISPASLLDMAIDLVIVAIPGLIIGIIWAYLGF